MADETTTGSVKEVAVDMAADEKKKKIIKVVVIIVIVAVLGWVVWKYVLKK